MSPFRFIPALLLLAMLFPAPTPAFFGFNLDGTRNKAESSKARTPKGMP